MLGAFSHPSASPNRSFYPHPAPSFPKLHSSSWSGRLVPEWRLTDDQCQPANDLGRAREVQTHLQTNLAGLAGTGRDRASYGASTYLM